MRSTVTGLRLGLASFVLCLLSWPGGAQEEMVTLVVKVPAGEYKDYLTVSSEGLKIDNQTVSITYYFAAKVGMVKQVVEVGGTKVTVELEKFEEKK